MKKPYFVANTRPVAVEVKGETPEDSIIFPVGAKRTLQLDEKEVAAHKAAGLSLKPQ